MPSPGLDRILLFYHPILEYPQNVAPCEYPSISPVAAHSDAMRHPGRVWDILR